MVACCCDAVKWSTTGPNDRAVQQMSEKTETVKALIERLTPEELACLAAYLRSKLPRHPLERKWDIDADVILDAIFRAKDITHRGVRGVVAEAVFEKEVLPGIAEKGWRTLDIGNLDMPYDFSIENESIGRKITIQVKLQRTDKGEPKMKKQYHPSNTYVVEVQKTRTGTKRGRKGPAAVVGEEETEIKTRPYQFGEFDILAVNMQPSTKKWSHFLYTVGLWLLPKPKNPTEIETLQPVIASDTNVWTPDIEECINWFLSGEKKKVFDAEVAKVEYAKVRDAAREAKKAEHAREVARRKAERDAARQAKKVYQAEPQGPR